MDFQNAGPSRLHVYLEYGGADCPGGSSGTFEPRYFELPPGGTREVIATVRSHAIEGQEDGISDGSIAIYWGAQLQWSAEAGLNVSSIEGQHLLGIEVDDEFSRLTGDGFPWLVPIIVAALVVVAILLAVARRGTDRGS